jgi:hypothetical protein
MKIALITGGQPRFTECFKILMEQITGFTSADFYFTFWKSNWADNSSIAENKIKKILNPKFNLKKVEIVEQPILDLPMHYLDHPPPAPENIRWWFYRRSGMWQSLRKAYNLIDEHYDLVIRFRVDGMLDKTIDLRSYNYDVNSLILPSWPRNGFSHHPINDQFAIGTIKSMNIYTELGDVYRDRVVQSDAQWEHNGHGTWAGEHVLVTHLNATQQSYVLGDFKSLITGAASCPIVGRSVYTDRHLHHSIIKDPTSI